MVYLLPAFFLDKKSVAEPPAVCQGRGGFIMATNGTTTTLSSKITVRFGDAILQEGFTTVPNLVLNHYARLGISPAEMMFTIHIWQHWWTEQDPYPSLKRLLRR